MASYAVELTPAAERQLDELASPARTVIAAALAALASNPRPPGCTKLAGKDNLWRVRVLQFRIIYTVIDRRLLVVVVKVGDRKDVYR